MTTNRRAQNKYTDYVLEMNGAIYGCYKDFDTAKQIADALDSYCVIRRGDEKIWES